MEYIHFIATAKEVKSRSLVSLDREARIVLITDDLDVMEIGRWPADITVTVTITRNQKGE